MQFSIISGQTVSESNSAIFMFGCFFTRDLLLQERICSQEQIIFFQKSLNAVPIHFNINLFALKYVAPQDGNLKTALCDLNQI